MKNKIIETQRPNKKEITRTAEEIKREIMQEKAQKYFEKLLEADKKSTTKGSAFINPEL